MHRMRRAALCAQSHLRGKLAVASGISEVTCGRDIEVGSIRVRLKGVDAMERGTPEGDLQAR